MSRICLPNVSVGPKIGQTQLVADSRICLSAMNVQMQPGESGVVIIYGSAGAIVYGAAGKIVY